MSHLDRDFGEAIREAARVTVEETRRLQARADELLRATRALREAIARDRIARLAAERRGRRQD